MIFAIVIFLAKLVAGSSYELGRRSYRSLREVEADLARVTGLTPSGAQDGFFASLNDVSLRGRLASGRGAGIEFFSHSENKTTVYYVRMRVEIDRAVELMVSQESLLTPLAKWLGFTTDVDTGDRSFDREFVVAGAEARTREAYARGLKTAIETAFHSYGVGRSSRGTAC